MPIIRQPLRLPCTYRDHTSNKHSFTVSCELCKLLLCQITPMQPTHPECSCSNWIVVLVPQLQRITPILKSLYWLKVSERIEYKIVYLTYKIINTTQPSYLYDLVSIQPPHDHNSRSWPYATLIKPSSSLKVTYCSFRHACLWTTSEFLILISPSPPPLSDLQ